MDMGLLINSGLFAALLGVAVAALFFLRAYIQKQTAKLLADIESETIQEAIAIAEDSVWTVVMQLANEMVDNMKAAAEDGKLTNEEIILLRTTARERALHLMGNEAYSVLKRYFADVDTWLYTKIDAFARESKK